MNTLFETNLPNSKRGKGEIVWSVLTAVNKKRIRQYRFFYVLINLVVSILLLDRRNTVIATVLYFTYYYVCVYAQKSGV